MSRTRSRNTIVTTPATSVAVLKTTGQVDPSRNNVQEGTIAGKVYSPAYTLTGYPGKVGRSETITDTTPGFKHWNPVSHTKDVWAAPLTTVVIRGSSTEYLGRECVATSTCTAGASMANMRTADGSWPLITSSSSLLALAASQMEFGVQSASTSLPVFLGELRELRDVFKNIDTRLTRWSEIMKEPMGKIRRIVAKENAKGTSFSSIVRQVMQVDLTFKFGLKPFYRDCQALMNVTKHLRAQRDRLNGGLTYLIARGKASANADNNYSLNPVGRDHYYSVYTTYDRTVRTWAMFKFDLTGIPRIPDYKILLDAYGFDEPTSAFWELLPYSWLIDYFVDVGSCLNNCTGQLIELPYTILQDGYSLKEEAVGNANLYLLGGSSAVKRSNITGTVPISGTFTRTRYVRVEGGIPYGGNQALPTLNLPSLSQGWTVFEVAAMRYL